MTMQRKWFVRFTIAMVLFAPPLRAQQGVTRIFGDCAGFAQEVTTGILYSRSGACGRVPGGALDRALQACEGAAPTADRRNCNWLNAPGAPNYSTMTSQCAAPYFAVLAYVRAKG